MTTYVHRVAAFIPVEDHADANTLFELMGFGANNFSVELSPSGEEPATAFGLSAAAQQSFQDTINAIHANLHGDNWGVFSQARVKEIVDAIVYTVVPSNGAQKPAAQFAALLEDNGLKMVVV